MVIPSATTQVCSATRATNRREIADLEVPALARSTLLPTGSSPAG
jgi:hypothetical protein